MKIKRLYIGDMGIYRNALMENIDSGIVVIGGLNRSGKTTLLEILRHMPYGFSKSLRPSNIEYSVECDLENEDNEKISLKINGLKEPQINFKDKNSKNQNKEIYGNIDKFTYSNIYTITLEELNRLKLKGEEEKLQAVLLGAGVSDIVHIPKLLVNLKNDKEKIGGKQGKPNIKFFKTSYDKLLSGIEAKDEALKQVGKFILKEKEETQLSEDILLEQENINRLQEQILLLEVLQNYFEDYKNVIDIKVQIEALQYKKFQFDFKNLPSIEKIETLYEEYIDVYNSYMEAEKNFESSSNKAEVNYNELIKSESKIKYYTRNISGLRQRQGEYNTLKTKYESDKESILKDMSILNSNFNGDFIKILNINCDLISEAKLTEVLEEIRAIKEEKLKWKSALETETLQGETIKNELKSLKNSDTGSVIKNYLYISLVVFVISLFVYFINKAFSAGLFITGVTSSALYYFVKQGSLNQINNRIINLELQLETIKSKQDIFKQKLDEINIKEKEAIGSFNYYIKSLQLGEEVSPQVALKYFKDIKELRTQIINLGNLGRKVEGFEQQLNLELQEINDSIQKIVTLSEWKSENILKHSSDIFEIIEMLDLELEAAKTFGSAKQTLIEVETKFLERLKLQKSEKSLIDYVPEIIEEYRIYNCLNELKVKFDAIERNISKGVSNERISKVLSNQRQVYNIDDTSNINYLYSMFKIYPIKSQIEKDIQIHSHALNESLNKLETLKEKLQVVKIELNNLATSDKIEQAQKLIDEGRLNLKPLALKYSVYHAAEFILETVQKDFFENAKHKLLKGAGDIFSKITDGEYKAVLPGDNLLQTDYKAIGVKGNIEETTSILSKGTGEQLYLSVRLNRIKDIKQKLPIIFDDPFVNFDDIHLRNTLKIISDLSNENQIFILTCHSEIIKLIEELRGNVQYWKLKKGNFKLSNSEELIEYLSEHK